MPEKKLPTAESEQPKDPFQEAVSKFLQETTPTSDVNEVHRQLLAIEAMGLAAGKNKDVRDASAFYSQMVRLAGFANATLPNDRFQKLEEGYQSTTRMFAPKSTEGPSDVSTLAQMIAAKGASSGSSRR